MSLRRLIGASLVLAGLAVCLVGATQLVERAAAQSARDTARIDALLSACARLRTSVLLARAGLELSFDDINQALSSLRATAREATLAQTQGAAYARAAQELMRSSQALQSDEAGIESFKTDLALLRLSSRYFPVAAQAYLTGDDTEAGPARDARRAAVTVLLAEVERFEESASRSNAQRLASAIAQVEALEPEAGPDAELLPLLGHTRVILDRRERVDRFMSELLRSPLRAHLEAARAAHERAANEPRVLGLGLRILASELAALGVIALGLAFVRARRAA